MSMAVREDYLIRVFLCQKIWARSTDKGYISYLLYTCRCGEDERPLNELLILQLGAQHPNGRYNISLCKIFGNHWNQEKKRFPRGTENNSVGNSSI